VIAIPLSSQTSEIYGALSVFYRRGREFTATDVELLSAFGTQASVAIENGRSFDRLTLKARHDEALHDFSQRLLEATAEEPIRRDAIGLIRALLGADCVGLFLLDTRAACLRLEAGLGWKPGTVGAVTITPSADSFAGYAFLHKAPLQVEDLSSERRFKVPAHLLAHEVCAGAVTPLGVRDQPIGVLAAYYRTPHRFGDEERRVLASIAHLTALALEKVRLYAELQANLRELQETQGLLIQADKLKALGTLLSGMAHELNNPLSTIQLSVQLLKQQHVLTDAVRVRMDVVEGECARAAHIIRELLVFARRKAPERQHADVNEVVEAALKLQAPQFDLNGISVVTALDPLPKIWADPHQLQQVLLNLFGNATHAMRSSGRDGVLTVRSAVHEGQVTIVVEDNGPGIPPEHLGRVFDPFFTTKRVGEGTGLGLSLSIGIVEAHGGRMSVENVPTSGARFTIRLPFGQGAEIDEAPVAPAAPLQDAEILVVEDETALRSILMDILTTRGHRVTEAGTGRAAIGLLEHGTYDAVMLDLMLPDLDGRGVWQWILSHRRPLADRVIFMTGDTMSAQSQRFLQETGRPVLYKPLAMDRIGQLVDEVLVGGEVKCVS
jgi:signal transduction histidine kinase/BarA-like signal transduction histidine kinase